MLSIDTGHERPYLPGTPYGSYFQSQEKMFPALERRKELPSKERVYGLRQRRRREGLAPRRAGARPRHQRRARRGAGRARRRGGARGGGRAKPGSALPALRGGRRGARLRGAAAAEFARGADGATLRDAAGGVWRIDEDALVGPTGERLPRIPGTLAYWFAWQAFHPDTALLPVEREKVVEEPLVF